MGKSLHRIILLLFTLCLLTKSFSLPRDSSKIKDFTGLFLNMSYPLFNYFNGSCNDKVCSGITQNEFNNIHFTFIAPYVGVGYIVKSTVLFFRTGVALSRCSKQINYLSHHRLIDINDKPYSGYGSGPFGTTQPMMGQTYYDITDEFKGKLYYTYLSINLDVGFNITKNFSIYFGYNKNSLLNYDFDGALYRSAKKYEVTNLPAPYQYTGTFIGYENKKYENKSIAQHLGQTISGERYATIGENIHFTIKNHVFFFEFEYNRSVAAPENRKSITNFKLGYVFKYWTF